MQRGGSLESAFIGKSSTSGGNTKMVIILLPMFFVLPSLVLLFNNKTDSKEPHLCRIMIS